MGSQGTESFSIAGHLRLPGAKKGGGGAMDNDRFAQEVFCTQTTHSNPGRLPPPLISMGRVRDKETLSGKKNEPLRGGDGRSQWRRRITRRRCQGAARSRR